MKRRAFVQLLAALAGLPFLAKATSSVRSEEVSKQLLYQSRIPVGTVSAYCGDKVPEGWLACDGSMINRSAYPELFKLLPCTPYNLDYRARLPFEIRDPGHSHGPVAPCVPGYIIKARP